MITTTTVPARRGRAASTSVIVGSAVGHYPGQSTARAYRVQLVDVTRPRQVTLDGRVLAERAPGGPAPGWSYRAPNATLTVVVGPSPTSRPLTVVETGGRPLDRPEPTTSSST